VVTLAGLAGTLPSQWLSGHSSVGAERLQHARRRSMSSQDKTTGR
jgi:hypothetical protein